MRTHLISLNFSTNESAKEIFKYKPSSVHNSKLFKSPLLNNSDFYKVEVTYNSAGHVAYMIA